MKRMYESNNHARGAVPGSDGRDSRHKAGMPSGASANTRRGLSGGTDSRAGEHKNLRETSSNTRDALGGSKPGAPQGKLVRQPR